MSSVLEWLGPDGPLEVLRTWAVIAGALGMASAFACGYLDVPDHDHEPVFWCVVAWPLTLVGGTAWCLLAGPAWLGRTARERREQHRLRHDRIVELERELELREDA